MPRRREVPKRPVMRDPKYGDTLVTKFMNIVMVDGKKAVAEQIVYGVFDVVADRI
jgi:small subunit ribosomal protein S7